MAAPKCASGPVDDGTGPEADEIEIGLKIGNIAYILSNDSSARSAAKDAADRADEEFVKMLSEPGG
ncbi:MAG TPA: hypothetical protein VI756_27025 [Blastocatellia bacterium]